MSNEHPQFLKRMYGVPVKLGLNTLQLPIAVSFLSVTNEDIPTVWYLSSPFAHESRQLREYWVRVVLTGEPLEDMESGRARYIGTVAAEGVYLHVFDVTDRYKHANTPPGG